MIYNYNGIEVQVIKLNKSNDITTSDKKDINDWFSLNNFLLEKDYER